METTNLDPATLLRLPLACYPSWWLRTTCPPRDDLRPTCRTGRWVSLIAVRVPNPRETMLGDYVARLRCSGCGQKPATVDLMDEADGVAERPARYCVRVVG